MPPFRLKRPAITVYGAISLAKRRPSRLTRIDQGGTPSSRSLLNPGVTRSRPRLWPPRVAPTCSPSTIPSPIAFGPEIAQTPSPCSCASGQYFSMNSLLWPNPPEAMTTAPQPTSWSPAATPTISPSSSISLSARVMRAMSTPRLMRSESSTRTTASPSPSGGWPRATVSIPEM